MERVTFLIEESGERVSCLLNPEDLEARRSAGLVSRVAARGALTGKARTDDPLVANGGGVTEYDIRLLFDMDIAAEDGGGGSDVRDRTKPLWMLAENAEAKDGFGAPPIVRLIWGKAWNVPGVVVHVAERLERFDAAGRPQRSWLSLRLRRVDPASQGKGAGGQGASSSGSGGASSGASSSGGGGGQTGSARPNATPAGAGRSSEPRPAPAAVRHIPVDHTGLPLARFDQIAAQHYGDPTHALALAAYNAIEDPLNLPPETRVAIPAAEALARRL